MIEIKRIIEEEHVPLYFKDTLVGHIENELEFAKARIDIRNEGVEGYYIIFNNKRINIKPSGKVEHWPGDLFSKMDNLLNELLGL